MPTDRTNAERQARDRKRRAERAAKWQDALDRIQYARTLKEAKSIAAKALDEVTEDDLVRSGVGT